VEVPPLSAKYLRQFQKKEIPLKSKVLIEEGVKAEDILDRILKDEMIVTLKGCKRKLHTGTNKIMMCQLPIAC